MSVGITDSLLFDDIRDITAPYPKTQLYSPSVDVGFIFHNELYDLSSTDGLILRSIIIDRNYISRIADYIEIEMMIPHGTWVYKIFPYLVNTEFTLKIKPQLKQPNKELVEKYKLVYILDKNHHVPTNTKGSESDLNQLIPLTIKFQLLNRAAEVVRIKTTQGNFNKKENKNKSMNVKDFILAVVGENTNKILIDNKPSIQAINIEDPDNTEDLRSVTLPSYTYVIDLPNHLQNKVQGIYTSGLGTYIQRYKNKDTFFVYSLYSGKKYNKQKEKINIYIPPNNSLSMSDVTYKYEDDTLRLLTTHNTLIMDNKDSGLMTSGSGVRLTNANSMMKKPVEITETGVKFKKSQLVTEFVVRDRGDGLNYAAKKPDMISSNIFKEVSEIKKNDGNYIELDWFNSEPSLLYPGVSCKIFYQDYNKKVSDKYGVIHRVHSHYSNNTINPIVAQNTQYVTMNCTTSLSIFIGEM